MSTWDAVVEAATEAGVANPRALLRRARERSVSAEVLLEGFRREAAWWEAHPDREPTLDDIESTPPGALDLRIFDQGLVWDDVFRVRHVISDRDDLDDDYLRNLVDFLQENREDFYAGYLNAAPAGTAQAPDAEVWLATRPLYQSLLAEALLRGVELP